MVKVKGHMGQGQIRVSNKGRWAHDNVKFYFILCIDVIKRSKVKWVKVKGHKRSRSKVRVKGQGHY